MVGFWAWPLAIGSLAFMLDTCALFVLGMHTMSAKSDEPRLSERDAARKARNDRVQEVVLLLAWLTKVAGVEAHLSPIEVVAANATMNHVVCVHHGGKRLAWRISDFEAFDYFRHLETRQCPIGLSRADKMAYLAEMVSK